MNAKRCVCFLCENKEAAEVARELVLYLRSAWDSGQIGINTDASVGHKMIEEFFASRRDRVSVDDETRIVLTVYKSLSKILNEQAARAEGGVA